MGRERSPKGGHAVLQVYFHKTDWLERQMAGLEDKLYNYEKKLMSMGGELGMTEDEIMAYINLV